MSSYDAAAKSAETQAQLAKGQGTFLSGEERQQIQRLLGFPEDFPPEFRDWILDYVAVNIPQIPISQITGFNQTQFYVGTHEDGVVSTTSTSYITLGSGGPIVTGLGAGRYLFFHGCALKSSTGGVEARQTLKFPGVAALSDNCLFMAGTEYVSSSRMVAYTLTEANNSVNCVYKIEGAGTGFFQLRWLFALRYGN